MSYNNTYHKLINEQMDVNNAVIEKLYKYPFDLICSTGTNSGDAYKYKVMSDANLLDFPVEIITKRNNQVTSAVVNDYYKTGNQVRLNEVKNFTPTMVNENYSSLWVNSYCDMIMDSDLESKVTVNQYTLFGNIKEYQKNNGEPVTIIWGYNDNRILAKIENASASDVEAITVPDPDTGFNIILHSHLSNVSDEDKEIFDILLGWQDKDAELIELGQILRDHLPNALVTTYTHDPLIGITSITDPRGITVYYEYDAENRLKYVKDKDQNILSENEYNYQPQN